MAIRLAPLTFQSLCDADSRIAVLFDKLITDLAKDCENRPYDKGKRKVTLDFILTPKMDQETGELDTVEVTTEAKTSKPIYRMRPIQATTNKGQLLFNLDIPEDVDQTSLFENQEDDDE